jgi:DNA-binding response OmpR family regulator
MLKPNASRLTLPPLRPPRVLIVDDEPEVCMFVARVLSKAGYETTTVSDGLAAVEAARLQSFDILVTDLMMPEMPGDEVAPRVRAFKRGLKVLYLTGFSDHLFKDRVRLFEGEAFLDKPCSAQGLLEAVSLLVFGRIENPLRPPQ